MATKDLARLPIMTEPIPAMRERFHKALWPVVDAIAIRRGDRNAYIPTKHRRHVFDFEQGFRVAVSIDKAGNRKVLHVSVSFHESGAGISEIRAASVALQSIGGDRFANSPDHQQISSNGIVHWFWEMK